jgi:hypothetical protein
MLIHDRDQIPLPALTAFSGERLNDIMTAPGWFRFCVVRHPYDRLFSAWRDKVFLCEPGFSSYAPGDGSKFVRFSEFVDKVVTQDDPHRCNSHWRSQVSLLVPDDIAYTQIYNLSNVHNIPMDLQEHLTAIGAEERPAPLQLFNHGYSISPAEFMSSDVLAALRKFYEADFSRFGFEEREATCSIPCDPAKFVNELTDAIFDRNQMIARHFEWARETRVAETERNRRIAELEQIARQSDRLQATIRALEAQVDKLRTTDTERSDEINRLAGENAVLRGSTSWRVTESFRTVMTFLRR